jgi:hypothetical protein
MAQLSWRAVWGFFRRLRVKLPYDLVTNWKGLKTVTQGPGVWFSSGVLAWHA